MTRIVLADDHPMIGSALELLFSGTAFEMVGRARTGVEAEAMIADTEPDLVLLDVNMPDVSGLQLLRRLRRDGCKAKIVLLTAGLEDTQLLAANQLAPEGIVLKTSDPALLLDGLEAVASGGRWIDPEIDERLASAKRRRGSGSVFTPRERTIIDLVRRGLRNREIAARIGVTEGTVKVYLHGVFDKAGVANRTELAMRADDLLGGVRAEDAST